MTAVLKPIIQHYNAMSWSARRRRQQSRDFRRCWADRQRRTHISHGCNAFRWQPLYVMACCRALLRFCHAKTIYWRDEFAKMDFHPIWWHTATVYHSHFDALGLRNFNNVHKLHYYYSIIIVNELPFILFITFRRKLLLRQAWCTCHSKMVIIHAVRSTTHTNKTKNFNSTNWSRDKSHFLFVSSAISTYKYFEMLCKPNICIRYVLGVCGGWNPCNQRALCHRSIKWTWFRRIHS